MSIRKKSVKTVLQDFIAAVDARQIRIIFMVQSMMHMTSVVKWRKKEWNAQL
jgi:hypothetical protein